MGSPEAHIQGLVSGAHMFTGCGQCAFSSWVEFWADSYGQTATILTVCENQGCNGLVRSAERICFLVVVGPLQLDLWIAVLIGRDI